MHCHCVIVVVVVVVVVDDVVVFVLILIFPFRFPEPRISALLSLPFLPFIPKSFLLCVGFIFFNNY